MDILLLLQLLVYHNGAEVKDGLLLGINDFPIDIYPSCLDYSDSVPSRPNLIDTPTEIRR